MSRNWLQNVHFLFSTAHHVTPPVRFASHLEIVEFDRNRVRLHLRIALRIESCFFRIERDSLSWESIIVACIRSTSMPKRAKGAKAKSFHNRSHQSTIYWHNDRLRRNHAYVRFLMYVLVRCNLAAYHMNVQGISL